MEHNKLSRYGRAEVKYPHLYKIMFPQQGQEKAVRTCWRAKVTVMGFVYKTAHGSSVTKSQSIFMEFRGLIPLCFFEDTEH